MNTLCKGWRPAWHMVAGAWLSATALGAVGEWWEQPHDKWYLKDDWKGTAAANYARRLRLQSPATNGWIVIWGNQGVRLSVNGQLVMMHVDSGLIYDADLTPFIQGSTEVHLQAGPGRVVAEGELVDEQGRRYPFALGCDWEVPVAPGVRLPPAVKPHRPAEASGAFHSAHNGRLIRYNDEERSKADIAKALARIQKLREQSIFLLRRYRAAAEILNFSPETLWRRAETYAAGPMLTAEKILRDRAVSAQKAGNFADAIGLAAEAGTLLAAAELAIAAATELEEAERHLAHLEACAGIMTRKSVGGAAVVSHPDPEGDGKAGAARRSPGEKESVPAKVARLVLDHDFAEVRGMLTAARREAGFDDWGNVGKHVHLARKRLDALESHLSRLWGSPVGRLDEFPEDRFGWLNASALLGPLPSQWEFRTDNARHRIKLDGVWSFRTDPANQGEELGWQKPGASLDGWRSIEVPGEWERQGILDDNDHHPADCPYRLSDRRCDDKPYNGYAWYRREIFLPNGRSSGVFLEVTNVANWLRVFVNGQPVGEPTRNGVACLLSADVLQPGSVNTIAIQVYNHDNFGGINGYPALGLAPVPPVTTADNGPLSRTFETMMGTNLAQAEWRVVTFASAMTPAVVVATDQPKLNLWGWEAKGFSAPQALTFMTTGGLKRVELSQDAVSVDGAELAEAWMLLSPGGPPDGRTTLVRSAPVLLALELRPSAITWEVNELGQPELEIAFGVPGSRTVLLRLDTGESEPTVAACRDWARRVRAVPVACSELAQLDKRQQVGDFRLQYHYLEIADFTGRPAERVAPLPMPLSFGLTHRFPGLRVDEHVTTGYASAHAPYRLRPMSDGLAYSTPLVDKSRLLKGVGELFAKRKPVLNMRGGNTEQQMFDDWKDWGFDHCRYAFAWGASWDIPLQKFMGGPISDDPELWARMDDLVKQHTDRGLMAMLCYFFNEDSPQRDSKNLVRNSTLYWRMHPEVRTNCYELWRRIADRYKDLPEWAVAYDFFNEPAYMGREDWNQIIKDLTRIVRSVDPKHLIVCEAGDGWSQPQWFLWLEPTGDTKTIYSFHHYGKHWGYDRDEYYPGYPWPPEKEADILLEAILFGIRHNVPLHCGEFGISQISPGEDHRVWLDDYLALLERFGIGWNWWNWSGGDIYRTGLKAGDEVSPNVAVLRKWIARKAQWR